VRRAVVLALVGLAVGGAGPARADPGLAFDVDGRTVVVTAEQLAATADVPETTYVVDGVAQPLRGTSVRAALALAGVDPDAISAVTASAGLALLQLTGPDVAAVPPFAEGPALVWVDAEGRTALLRPASASGRAAQVIRSAPNAPLSATVEGATAAEVAIITNVERAEVGERVALMAQSSAEDASYTWDFGDGTTARGEHVEHRFRRPGRYRVTVTAAGAGASRPVVIIVDEPQRRTVLRSRQAGANDGSADGPVATPGSPDQSGTAPVATPKAKPASQRRRRAKAGADRAEARPPARDPNAVAGTVLADAAAAPAPAASRSRPATRAASAADGFTVPPVVLVAAGAVALGGAGAWWQRRRSP